MWALQHNKVTDFKHVKVHWLSHSLTRASSIQAKNLTNTHANAGTRMAHGTQTHTHACTHIQCVCLRVCYKQTHMLRHMYIYIPAILACIVYTIKRAHTQHTCMYTHDTHKNSFLCNLRITGVT